MRTATEKAMDEAMARAAANREAATSDEGREVWQGVHEACARAVRFCQEAREKQMQRVYGGRT